MNKDLILSVNKEMEVTAVDEKLVIFEPTGTKIYLLDEEEKEIFQLFDGVNKVGDVEEKLQSLYESESIADDLIEYVTAMVEKGVLVEKKLCFLCADSAYSV